MTKLSVNVNKIATLRNARGGNVPNLIALCHKIISYGAQGITIHPRADERHITRADAITIGQTKFEVETNFEGDLREDFVHLVLKQCPTQCTLVPTTHGEVTSNHGWNLKTSGFMLAPVISKMRNAGIRVSLFVDAGDSENIKRAADIGADRVEIYTEPYAIAFAQSNTHQVLADIRTTINAALKLNIGVNAGHDLTTHNLPTLIKHNPEILEVSIGHHLICDALEVGIKQAVANYLQACQNK